MDKMRWLWITCAIVTFVGVTLSVFSLILIADMAKKAEAATAKTEEFYQTIDARVDGIEQTVNIISANVTAWFTPESTPPSTDVEADVLFESICIRSKDEKIAIYTSDGILLRTLDINVSTLPTSDQQALERGITVNSWRELFALIEDLG
ncbi:MAG: hypothetical protein IJW16_08115 [Clostridia bacterium]|nr:hypothetical protein [Clostridia bacterium]